MAAILLEDNYVRNWLPHFDYHGDLAAGVFMGVKCDICFTRLAILHPAHDLNQNSTGVEQYGGNIGEGRGGGVEEIITDDDHEIYETFAVLPCGHAFGYTCIRVWLESNHEPNCPICRKTMGHSTCRHIVDVQPIVPGNGYNIHQALSHVLSGNEQIPPVCPRCRGNSVQPEPNLYGQPPNSDFAEPDPTGNFQQNPNQNVQPHPSYGWYVWYWYAWYWYV
ncbi:hypothetical protein F5Y19DRAFT_389739 [Xylariaceae sp. FL1651]|nr:hypothetical protein F5Y19DRAFT_389739 [Xylariaceae sp. FL1651]